MSDDKIVAADAPIVDARAHQIGGSRLSALWVDLASLYANSPLRLVASSGVNFLLITFSDQVSRRKASVRDKSFDAAPSSQLVATLKTAIVATAKRICVITKSRGHGLDSISQSGLGHTLTIQLNSAANLFTRDVVIQKGMPQ